MVNVVIALAAWATLLVTIKVNAQWPPTSPPYFDDCYVKSQKTCRAKCSWSVSRFPWCFNTAFLALKPSETIDVTDNIGMALKFFYFSYGIHLSEGTMKQDYYNVLVDDCAMLCIQAVLQPGNRRCLVGFNLSLLAESGN
jgi:hypothetical protein